MALCNCSYLFYTVEVCFLGICVCLLRVKWISVCLLGRFGILITFWGINANLVPVLATFINLLVVFNIISDLKQNMWQKNLHSNVRLVAFYPMCFTVFRSRGYNLPSYTITCYYIANIRSCVQPGWRPWDTVESLKKNSSKWTFKGALLKQSFCLQSALLTRAHCVF